MPITIFMQMSAAQCSSIRKGFTERGIAIAYLANRTTPLRLILRDWREYPLLVA